MDERRKNRIESTLKGKAYFEGKARQFIVDIERCLDDKTYKTDIKSSSNTEKIRTGGANKTTEDRWTRAIDECDRQIKAIKEQMAEECGYYFRLKKAVGELSAVEQDFVRNHYYRRLKGRALAREMKYTQRHLLRIKEDVLEKLGEVRE